jgi:hypothetical protein
MTQPTHEAPHLVDSKIEYQSVSAGRPRSSLSAVDLIVAAFMLSFGSCLIWFCVYVLLKPSPPDGLRLILWCIMFVIGTAGLVSVYAGIRLVLRVKAREKRREMDRSANQRSEQ